MGLRFVPRVGVAQQRGRAPEHRGDRQREALPHRVGPAAAAVQVHVQARDRAQPIAGQRLPPGHRRRLGAIAHGDRLRRQRTQRPPVRLPAARVGQHHQPADVEQRAADRGQLPVDDAGQPPAVVQHVAGLVVAVHQAGRRASAACARAATRARAAPASSHAGSGALASMRSQRVISSCSAVGRSQSGRWRRQSKRCSVHQRVDALLPQRRHRLRRAVERRVGLPDEERRAGQERPSSRTACRTRPRRRRPTARRAPAGPPRAARAAAAPGDRRRCCPRGARRAATA